MKFIVYETANLINGKKYRGVHVCETLDDGYLGSGKLLKKAIAKYGASNFQRIILLDCASIEDMFFAESQLVTMDWVARPDTYNLKVGGEGGWDYINKSGARWNNEKREAHSIEMKRRALLGIWKPPLGGTLGKSFKHTNEAKSKISANSAMTLSTEEVEKRQLDVIHSDYPKRGSTKRLSQLWNVSHTQVRRFIRGYGVVVTRNLAKV